MTEKTIEIEAATLEEARAKAKSQVPEGLHILSEQVITDGRPNTIKETADTIDVAFEKARGRIPANATFIDQKELSVPEKRVIKVQALDQKNAESAAKLKLNKNEIFKDVKLAVKGKKGFLGIREMPNEYEVDVLRQAIVEITFKENAKISIQTATLEEIIGILKTGGERERLRAAHALGNIGDKEAVDPLCEALNDAYHHVRASAAMALRTINDKKAVDALINALYREHARIEQADLAGHGLTGGIVIGSGSALMDRLENPYFSSTFVLVNIMQALGRIGDPRAVEPIGSIFSGRASSRDSGIWSYAVDSLGDLRDPGACKYIIPILLNNGEDCYRKQAARNLGKIGGDMAANALTRALNTEPSDDVKREIERALEQAKKG
jgi:HEAT repeat protein